MFFDRKIQYKTPAQVRSMRAAGLVVASTLSLLRSSVAPGVTTLELDALAEAHIRSSGALPSFLGYQGFPASICTSVNDEVVHGIPGPRVLRAGDLISIDCGAIVDGWHGDAAITVPVGAVDASLVALAAACESALWAGLAAVVEGHRIGDITQAVSSTVAASGAYSVVEDYVGHGIGTEMHQAPDVPNTGKGRRGAKLVPGLVVAVEPMICLGSAETDVLDDDWTVVTSDGAYAAHCEHTVAVTPDGPWVLTEPDGGVAKFAELGITVPER
ncbi:methionyl aminopeptidase [Tenggerimyces flavus]|nr:methionyl aminopeptidase [Tenggerimyces flavus]